MYVAMMKRYSSVEVIDERLRCGHDVEAVMMQICLDDLMSKM